MRRRRQRTGITVRRRALHAGGRRLCASGAPVHRKQGAPQPRSSTGTGTSFGRGGEGCIRGGVEVPRRALVVVYGSRPTATTRNGQRSVHLSRITGVPPIHYPSTDRRSPCGRPSTRSRRARTVSRRSRRSIRSPRERYVYHFLRRRRCGRRLRRPSGPQSSIHRDRVTVVAHVVVAATSGRRHATAACRKCV